MSSRFIYVIACVRISFLYKANYIPLYVHTMFCLFIPLSINTWIFSNVLAIADNAAVNMSVRLPPRDPAFNSFEYTRGRTAGSYGNSIFNLLRKYHTVFQSGYTFPPTVHRHFNFSISSPTLVISGSLLVAILMGVRWYFIVPLCFCTI